MTSTLEPYDPDQSCPKCDGRTIRTQWFADSSHPGCLLGERLRTGRAGDHLERTCVRCGYRWEQQCPDPTHDHRDEDPGLLTDLEHQALDHLAEFSRLLIQIVAHGATRDHDFDELYHHVHVLQRTIGSQAGARAYPDRYRLLGDTIPRTSPGAVVDGNGGFLSQ